MSDSGSEAPLETSTANSKAQFQKQFQATKLQAKKLKEIEKKRKLKWRKIRKNKREKLKKRIQSFDESHFSKNDFSSMEENEKSVVDKNQPPLKKRKVSQWIQESDLFHFPLENKINVQKPMKESIFSVDYKKKEEKEISVPLEVISMFENAIRESTSNEEIRHKWKDIIQAHKIRSKNIPLILNRFDHVFVDGFKIEVNSVYRLNKSALQRATKLKKYSSMNHHRIDFDQQRSGGHFHPAFHFKKKEEQKSNKEYVYTPKTIWGSKTVAIQQVKSQNLQKLFDNW